MSEPWSDLMQESNEHMLDAVLGKTASPAAIAEAQNDLARLKREQAYGQAHPFAGYCGEDDARLDLIHDLEVWLKENA